MESIAWILASYFFISAFAMTYTEMEDVNVFGKVFFTLFLPVMVIAQGVWNVALWLERYTQWRTFFRYLFRRKTLLFDKDVLDRMQNVADHHFNSRSLSDRIWRFAHRLVTKVNTAREISRKP